MMNHSYTTSSVMCIGLVLTLLMAIGATTTTTTVGTPMKPMANVPPIKKSTLRTCKQGTSQGLPHLFIEKNSSKATTVALYYVSFQPSRTGINIDQEEEQRNKLHENYPDKKKEKK